MIIGFEGIDGTGKSSLACRLASFLENRGMPCVVARDPWGTDFGRQFRSSFEAGSLHPMTEFLSFLLAGDHLRRTVIAPSVSQGKTVIMDRGPISMLAYQMVGNGLPRSLVYGNLMESVSGMPVPDFIFVLLLSPERAMVRSRARGGAVSRYERDSGLMIRISHFYEEITGYSSLYRLASFGRQIIGIDANQDEDQIFLDVLSHLKFSIPCGEPVDTSAFPAST
ncbi:dTMP kinase [Leptospirillum ferriphilum]|uniref:dTMP kinase n=1 Tax=Leptospirillum ferriphilum TaxID=178606 RepID=UPI0006B1CC7C|nr:dTMP kinase [Leptospirillum ferriphilum]